MNKIPVVDDANGSVFYFAELTTAGLLRLTLATLVDPSTIQGPPGGQQWIEGAGPPNDANGTNGMFYLDTLTDDIYEKNNGTWY